MSEMGQVTGFFDKLAGSLEQLADSLNRIVPSVWGIALAIVAVGFILWWLFIMLFG